MKIKLDNLTKHFGKVAAVNELTLDIKDGEFVALLGPSGCGKTTTMLMIAGIYKPTKGQIIFEENIVNQWAPKDRHIGMVFQSYALYPHMTVYQNLAYPLVLKKRPKEEIKRESQRVADLLGIGHLLDRKPGQLSGGQQQRVALGRALIKKPQVLLFDEPLSNLDARLRISMRSMIKNLQKDLGITSIYVTHDQVEAMTMADRIAVMKDGVLQAFTDPEDLHDRPRTLFVAQFVGNPPMNLFDVELVEKDGILSAFFGSGAVIQIPNKRKPKTSKKIVKMGIRPQDIHSTNETGLESVISFVEPMGRDNLIVTTIGELDIHFLEDPGIKLKANDKVNLEFDLDTLQFFDNETGLSLLWT